MDQLSKDAAAARIMGLSYGQYMARKPRKPAPVRYPKKQTEESAKKKGVCVICGEPITGSYKGRKYCSVECAAIAQERRDRERYGKD